MRKFVAMGAGIAVMALLVLILTVMAGAKPLLAQGNVDAAAVAVESEQAAVAAPVVEQLEWSAEAPTYSQEQLDQMQYWVENTHLPGPTLAEDGQMPVAAPAAGTESAPAETRARSGAPLAPGDHKVYSGIGYLYQIGPQGASTSNVLEHSQGQVGRYVFATGNWYAARSTDQGANWTYISPYAGYSDFCCDQVADYDASRNNFYWLRQGVASTNPGTGNYENTFKLSVSTSWNATTFCTYTFTPTSTNAAWTNQWWDYPHMQMGADYLYIAFNMFNQVGAFTRSVMLRFPLDSLSACAGFGYNYYNATDWFTFVPVQGADHVMYFASNWPSTTPQNSRLRIWKWDESASGLSYYDRTVTAWTATGRGDAQCGAASGDWAARTDQRLLSGARYRIQNSNMMDPSKNVVGWWWNVGQGGGFAQPYIDAAAFYEDGITQVAGGQGRPYVWSSTYCFLYPSVAANKRGDFGIALNGGTSNPNLYFGYSDDFTAAPPGFSLSLLASSSVRPADNKWGDYNTVRAYQPTGNAWVVGGHYLGGASNCTNCGRPWYGVVGRERDIFSWRRWWWR